MAEGVFLPDQVDFTNKDRAAILSDLQTKILARFPQWTDFSEASFGNILLELISYVGDNILYYQDAQAAEVWWGFATRRRNLLNLGRQIGFKPKPASAATVTLRFTLPVAAGDDVTIPINTQVKTGGGLIFETVAQLIIATPALFGDVVVKNSQIQSSAFTGTGLASQEYVLTQTPYVDASAVVTVDAAPYKEVTNFLDSETTDKHFVVIVDENDQATVRFGNGINGQAPANGSAIASTYEIGGGVAGNVAATTITVLPGTFQDDSSVTVQLTISNAAAATGGADRETEASIRERAPLTLRQVGNRTVSKDDYVAHSEEISGVERAVAYGQADDSALLANEAKVVIVPTGVGVPTTALKTAVKTNLTVTKPNTIGIKVTVADPTYKVIAITADITLATGADQNTVNAAVTKALDDYFSPRNADGSKNTGIDFGPEITEIPFSDLFRAVANVPGVRKVAEDLFIPADDTLIALGEFPKAGVYTLNYV